MPGVLTEGLERAGRDAEVPAARSSGDSWRRRWTEVAAQGAGCFSKPRTPPKSKRRNPVEVLWGQEGGELRRRRGISVTGRPTRGGARPKSGRFRCCSRGWWPQGASWYTGEAAAVVCRGYGATGWCGHGGADALRGGARRRWGWSLVAAQVRRGRVREGARGQI